MKYRTFLVSLFVLCLGTVVSASFMNTDVDLGDVHYSVSTNTSSVPEEYDLWTSLDISCGVISHVGSIIYRTGDMSADVCFSIYGLLDVQPELGTWQYQSFHVNRRGGQNFSNYGSLGSWQGSFWNVDDPLEIVYGDIFSSASLGAHLSGVSIINGCYGSYNEFDSGTFEWSDDSGNVFQEVIPAHFQYNIIWNMEFSDTSFADTAVSVGTPYLTTPVPEPVLFGVVGCSGLTLMRRSRQHQ